MSGNVEPTGQSSTKKVYVQLPSGVCVWITEKVAIELGLLPDPAIVNSKPVVARNKMRTVRHG